MRALHAFPVFPGEPDEGSSVYSRSLTRELSRRGVEVEVVTTRARRLRARRLFDVTWPNELPREDRVDGLDVHRFASTSLPGPAGALVNRAVFRHWRRRGTLASGEDGPVDADALFETARDWPRHLDLAARLGRGPLSPALLRAARSRAEDVDVVLAGHAPFGLPGWVQAAAARSGTPVVLLPFLHEGDPFHHLPSLHAAYERAAAVLTLSPHTAELLARHLPAARPVAIGAGADLSVFESDAVSGDRFRERHGLAGRRLILFVGRKEAGKRYDLALRAAASLPADCTLVIVGRDVDGEPLPSGVLYLARLEPAELADAYDACELLLHPSEQESFGMVCLEAWLRRKPVFANARCGASAALVESGRDGLLLDPSDDWGLAARALLDDPERARAMGEAGREKVLGEFTWERVGARALEVLEEVAGAR